MEIEISRELLEERCPEALFKLPEGPYIIHFGEMISSMPLEDVFAGKPRPADPTPEERFEKQVLGVRIMSGRKVYKTNNDNEMKNMFADVIIGEFQRMEDERKAEEARFLSLSEEEREEELTGLLEELFQYPGFMALKIDQE